MKTRAGVLPAFFSLALLLLLAGSLSSQAAPREATEDDVKTLEKWIKSKNISGSARLSAADIMSETSLELRVDIEIRDDDRRNEKLDLSLLRGMPIRRLSLYGLPVKDISPLSGIPLVELSMNFTSVTDLSPLRGMPLQTISFDDEDITRGMDDLAEIGTLEQVNGRDPWIYFAQYFAEHPPKPGEKTRRQRSLELQKPPLQDHTLDVPTNYVASELKWLPATDLSMVKPFFIKMDEINAFVKEARSSSNPSNLISRGQAIFRPYAQLPKGFDERISDFRVGGVSNCATYCFRPSSNEEIRILVDMTNTLVLSCLPEDSSDAFVLHVSRHNDEMLGLLLNFLDHKAAPRAAVGYNLYPRAFGKKTFVFSLCFEALHPQTFSHHCVMLADSGYIEEMNAQSITRICLAEFPQSDDPNVHKVIMKAFLVLEDRDLAYPSESVVSSVRDIPVYQKQKLAPEAEAQIRPMLTEITPSNSVIYTFCTYKQLGGTVRKYRFEFKDRKVLRVPTVVELGKNIGAAAYEM